MAEEKQEQQAVQAETEQRPAVPSKKKILLLLLPIFLVVGTVIGLYFSGMADSFLTVGHPEDTEAATAEEKQELPTAVFFDVPEMLINLSVKAGQKPIYFKVKVALEMATVEDADFAEKMLPRIIDSLQFYLREMRLEEIQGSVGTYRLKEEIQTRLNRILAPVKVNDVLFKEILIQ